MIPSLTTVIKSPFKLLPPGIHLATIEEVKLKYAYNRERRKIFVGLLRALKNLRIAGCEFILLDGSFITDKEVPGDYDGCWSPNNIQWNLIDPVFIDLEDLKNGRKKQKLKFLGELFDASILATKTLTFKDFFQNDRDGNKKGIIQINLKTDPYFNKGGQQ